MANTLIQLKRSSVPGNTPANSSIQPGELAVNLVDRKLFTKDTANVVFELTTSGPQGSTGSQGAQGTTGSQGAQGAQGTTGSQGSTGSQGAQGAQGYQGIKGDQYYTTSSTSYTIQIAGNSGTIVIGTGLAYSAGQAITIANDASHIQNATVNTYSTANGQLIFQTTGNTGTGTFSSWTVNLAGAVGATGPQGDTGSQGAQGAQGSTGTQGAQGNQGTTGTTGSQGAQGTTGLQGAQGAQGNQGTTGSQGAQGTTGSQGAQGSQGTAGTTGSQGAQGAQGTAGTTGSQGAQGNQGTAGSQGAQGSQGTTGTQGAQGNQGTTGTQGATGSLGPTGPQGAQGAQGTAGTTGAQGSQGAQGTTGSQGPQGAQGTTGTQGAQGAQGNQGPQGAQSSVAGPQGSQGAQGAASALAPSTYVVRAIKNGSSQTINNGSDAVVTLVDDFDPQGWFTSNQFKPTVAGYYSMDAQVWWNAGTITNNQINIQLRKNGSTQLAITQDTISNVIGMSQSISTETYFNGSTDYVELTAYTANPTSQDINGASGGTWFNASLLAYGQQGATGSQGPQGTAGTQGINGTQGAQGAQGAQGTTGSQGTAGTQGAQGAQGTTGLQGAQGTQGTTGTQGATGSLGPTGPQGAQGAQGNQGTAGSAGSQGAQGAQGTTGSQGAQGAQGNTGTTGSQGAQGTTGSQGAQGAQGTAGSSGSQGAQGTAGSQGAQGAQGTTGPQGSQGAQGSITLWTRKTSAYTAVAFDRIIADTSGGVFNITLPASPSTGQSVQITDGSDWSVNNLTVLRNGSTIEGIADDLLLNYKGITVELVYDGTTWEVTATLGAKGSQGAQGAQGTVGPQGTGPQGPQGAQGSPLPRVVSTTSGATITPTSATADQYNVTALATDATIAAPSGTPSHGQRLMLRIKDDGAQRLLTWTTTSGGYRPISCTLPTATTISKTIYVACVYNTTDTFWDVLGVGIQN